VTHWPLLDGLDPGDRERVLTTARRRTFARGETVFHRGDPADSLHLIVKGRFAARVVTPLGDTVTFALLGAGQQFGEIALVAEGATRSASIVALEPGETRALHRRDFEALQADHPVVARALLAALADHVRRLSDRLVEALHVPADVRVLRRVAELHVAYGADEIPLTQEDLAGLAGTSRATVNRVLRDAERRGELRLARGRTTVLDADALGRRARSGHEA
jgi:CRP-like cAMP-binding protein